MRTFEELSTALAKPGEDILRSLTPEKCDLWHMASCIPGEGGELFDAVKKHVIYEREIDRENVVEELADLRFYMARVQTLLGITEDEMLASINDKLGKRYGEKYSNAAAQARADKAVEDDGFITISTDFATARAEGMEDSK